MKIQSITSIKAGQSKSKNLQAQGNMTTLNNNPRNGLDKDTVSFTGIWSKSEGKKGEITRDYHMYGGYSSSEYGTLQKYYPYSWEISPQIKDYGFIRPYGYSDDKREYKNISIDSNHPDFSLRDFDDIHNRQKPYINTYSSDPQIKEKYYLLDKSGITTSDIDTELGNRLDRQSSLHELQKDLNYKNQYMSDKIKEAESGIRVSESSISSCKKNYIKEGNIWDNLKWELGGIHTIKGRYISDETYYKGKMNEYKLELQKSKEEKVIIEERIKTAQAEEKLLIDKRNAGNLVDISAQNHWQSNEPMYNFLNWVKGNQHETNWISEKYVATPHKTTRASTIILEAHNITKEAIKVLNLSHKESIIRDLIKNSDFVDTVMKHVINITKVV